MKSKLLPLVILTLFSILTSLAQEKKYLARGGVEIKLSEEELSIKLPAGLKPLFDYSIRDVSICIGPDSTYYMTGTTGAPDWWNMTSEIKVWKSKDLKNWFPVVEKPRVRATVWNVDRDGSPWQQKGTFRNDQFFRPMWAPEIHYLKGTFWLTISIPGVGNGILKSTSGKAEGPYISALNPDQPLNTNIDGSLFLDDDGKVYSVSGNGRIIPLKDDLSGPSGPSQLAVPANFKHVGFEGAFLFKIKRKYYMAAAESVNGDYHCFIASADQIYGPYSDRYLAIPHAGHNMFFSDLQGNLWSTIFGNNGRAPFKEKPGILRVMFDEHGHIKPVLN